MDAYFDNLPPLKRFRLMQQHHPEPEPEPMPKSLPPISPSHLPAKKRKHSRNPSFDKSENLPPSPITPPTPYCLPAKKRIWAFKPPHISPIKSPLSIIDLNVEYTPSPPKKNLSQDRGTEPESSEVTAIEEDAEEEEEDGILCAVCESTDGDPIDPIVFCDGCDLMVHSTCYGNPLVKGVPEGDWFCARCSNSANLDNPGTEKCCLCPVVGGAMKPTNDGRWAHIVCAVLVPEVFFEDPEGRDGIDCSKVPKKRWREVCYLCKGRRGCAVECSEMKCPLSFHVTCGLKEELCIELKEGRSTGGVVAAFCKKHTQIWKEQQQTGKYKIVARDEDQ